MLRVECARLQSRVYINGGTCHVSIKGVILDQIFTKGETMENSWSDTVDI